MKPVIEVNQLGKRFCINDSILQQPRRRSLIESLTNAVLVPFRRIQDPAGQANWRDFWALRDVSFSIDQGEVVGIIGLNGAGKSTLLKILTRICEPTLGEVRLRGRVGSLLEVGTGFHPELTGRENVFLNGSILGMSQREIRNKFDEIVEFSGVERFLDTPVKRYSSGMRVRLAFSVAANLNPEILIIDEVLAVGDAPFRAKCIEKMRSLATSGRTVLFVSHNTSAILKLCTRAIQLEKGQVRMDGAPEEVVRDYLGAGEGAEEGSRVSASEDLLHRARQGSILGQDVRISRCSISGKRGESSGRVQFGEPFDLELEIQGRCDIKGLSVTLGIDSESDSRVAAVASEQQNLTINTTPGSVHTLVMSFQGLPLSPGTYFITAGVRTLGGWKTGPKHGRVALDRIEKCLAFEVLSDAYEGFTLVNNIHGHILPQPKWQLKHGNASVGSERYIGAA